MEEEKIGLRNIPRKHKVVTPKEQEDIGIFLVYLIVCFCCITSNKATYTLGAAGADQVVKLCCHLYGSCNAIEKVSVARRLMVSNLKHRRNMNSKIQIIARIKEKNSFLKETEEELHEARIALQKVSIEKEALQEAYRKAMIDKKAMTRWIRDNQELVREAQIRRKHISTGMLFEYAIETKDVTSLFTRVAAMVRAPDGMDNILSKIQQKWKGDVSGSEATSVVIAFDMLAKFFSDTLPRRTMRTQRRSLNIIDYTLTNQTPEEIQQMLEKNIRILMSFFSECPLLKTNFQRMHEAFLQGHMDPIKLACFCTLNTKMSQAMVLKFLRDTAPVRTSDNKAIKFLSQDVLLKDAMEALYRVGVSLFGSRALLLKPTDWVQSVDSTENSVVTIPANEVTVDHCVVGYSSSPTKFMKVFCERADYISEGLRLACKDERAHVCTPSEDASSTLLVDLISCHDFASIGQRQIGAAGLRLSTFNSRAWAWVMLLLRCKDNHENNEYYCSDYYNELHSIDASTLPINFRWIPRFVQDMKAAWSLGGCGSSSQCQYCGQNTNSCTESLRNNCEVCSSLKLLQHMQTDRVPSNVCAHRSVTGGVVDRPIVARLEGFDSPLPWNNPAKLLLVLKQLSVDEIADLAHVCGELQHRHALFLHRANSIRGHNTAAAAIEPGIQRRKAGKIENMQFVMNYAAKYIVTDRKEVGSIENSLFLPDLEFSFENLDLLKLTISSLVCDETKLDLVIGSYRSQDHPVVASEARDGYNVEDYDDFLFHLKLLEYLYTWMAQDERSKGAEVEEIAKRHALIRNPRSMIVCFLHLRLRIWEKLTRMPLQQMWTRCSPASRQQTLQELDQWLGNVLVKKTTDKFAFFTVDADKLTVSIPGNKWRKVSERKEEFLRIVYRDTSVTFELTYEDALQTMKYFDNFVQVVSAVDAVTKRTRKMTEYDIATLQINLDEFKDHYLKCCKESDVTIYLHVLFSGHFAEQLRDCGGDMKTIEGQSWEHIMADIKTIIHHQTARDGGNASSVHSALFTTHKMMLRKQVLAVNNGGRMLNVDDWGYKLVQEKMNEVGAERKLKAARKKAIKRAAAKEEAAVVEDVDVVDEHNEDDEEIEEYDNSTAMALYEEALNNNPRASMNDYEDSITSEVYSAEGIFNSNDCSVEAFPNFTIPETVFVVDDNDISLSNSVPQANLSETVQSYTERGDENLLSELLDENEEEDLERILSLVNTNDVQLFTSEDVVD